ncbi:Rrp15p-domain-containing protein [Camillea tinctor]|nr:Rrp15p-domain-containing protein [Camillea tinctor]
MAGPNAKKRNHKDISSKLQRPGKKQKRSQEYHSDSSEPEPEPSNPNDFQPVNLLDSDNEDLDNIVVDDVSSFGGESSDSDSGTNSDDDNGDNTRSRTASRQRDDRKLSKPSKYDDSSNNEDDDEDNDEEEDDDHDNEEGAEVDDTNTLPHSKKSSKSKRNDPSAFSTSMSKILSSKLSTSRRADPVLSRSAEAHKAAQDAVDSALESKARRYLREQKRLALEKGRVKDVLTGGPDDGGASAAEVVQAEKRLRKVAHRGVVVLFRAVREAQERAVEAERDARKDGIFGVVRREEKVNEMSRQGFLDLIAGGGGKLKKGPLEEA